MKLILEANVLFVKEAKGYTDNNGKTTIPEHKSVVYIEDNQIDEEGNVRPSTKEIKCFLDKSEILKGKAKFEVKVSAYKLDTMKRPELSIKITKVLK